MQNNSIDVDQQRIIELTIVRRTRKPKKSNDSGTIFPLHSPKKILSNLLNN